MRIYKPLLSHTKFISIPALLLIVFITGCNKNQDESGSNGLIPLKIGNSWKYTDSTPSQVNGQMEILRTYTDKVFVTETHDNKLYYVGYYTLRNVDENTIEVVRPNGVIQTFFKKVYNNITLVRSDTLGLIDTTCHQLVAYPGTFTVNGYQCIKNEELYTRPGRIDSKYVYYIKPRLGIVRMETYLDGITLFEKADLIDYSLK